MRLRLDEFDKLQRIRRKQEKQRAKTKKEKKEEKKKANRLWWNEKQSLRLQHEQRKNKNPNELRFRDLLKTLGINYIWQQPFFDDKRFVCVDFYLPDVNIVVEIDGYIHRKQKQKDLNRTIYLKKIHGIKGVVRVTNEHLALNLDVVASVMEKYSI